MKINGRPATEWRPDPQPAQKGARRKPPPRAHYSRSFEEIQAYTAMGLTNKEYDALPGIPYWLDEECSLSKSHVIAWYRDHMALENLRVGIF